MEENTYTQEKEPNRISDTRKTIDIKVKIK